MILDLYRKDIRFDNIHGYDDIKDIVRRVLDTEENYNLIFIGPPASANETTYSLQEAAQTATVIPV
jgi:cellulose biosynthesis protein BcsQ